MKKKKKNIKRDQIILAAFQRYVNLNVKIVKSKKIFNRKHFKEEFKRTILEI